LPRLSPAALKGQEGVVKWFDDEKGFGFITPDDVTPTGGREVFVHHTGILMQGRRTLEAGQRVKYILDFNEKGPIAVGVARD
jgi:CspA family cold shock protein